MVCNNIYFYFYFLLFFTHFGLLPQWMVWIHFISKLVDWSLLFFKVLQKLAKFAWDEKCELPFADLKKFLGDLSMLYKLVIEKCLWLYLVVGEETVSSILICQERIIQKLIYFISYLLKNVEGCYMTLKRLTLTLVLIARRLRPYFLHHPLTMLTNNTLGCIMTNPKTSEGLIKWTIELSEYDI